MKRILLTTTSWSPPTLRACSRFKGTAAVKVESQPLVMTIGHSTHPLAEFIGLLQTHGVTDVVDVRTVPCSRHNPQFNKTSLPRSLKKAGLSYVHFPGLGGLRHAMADSTNLGWRNMSFRGYADYMQTPEFAQSLDALIQRAKGGQIVFMCAEAVPWRCHRSLIANALLVRCIRTEDIMNAAHRLIHKLTPFAKVRGMAITYPTDVDAGIAQAARRGVLIKGGIHLENLGRLNTVALDKTGTLTTGHFAVTQVIGLDGTPEEEVLRIAAAVEEQSSHPLAKAILRTAREHKIDFPTATEIENLAGKGIQALVEGAEVLVGALRSFADDPAAKKGQSLTEVVAQLEAAGQTTVIIRRAGRFIGVIGLADEPRPLAGEVMKRLRSQGIERLVMLTGDNDSVARRVAEQIGITEVRAELLPANKLTIVHELEQERGVIAMIGDGVNDAPALAAATVGVAMGTGGTAVALETADVVLMGDDLGKLSFAIGLSRASQRIIRQNLVIALGVIFLLLIASGFGVIPLSLAVVLHEGSTIVVVLNALRLLAWHEPAISTATEGVPSR